MKKIFLKLSVVVLVIIGLQACKKDEAGKSRTELISQGTWHLTMFEVQTDGVLDTANPVQKCNQFDTLTFSKELTGNNFSEIPRRDSANPQCFGTLPYSAQWAFKNYESQIVITDGPYKGTHGLGVLDEASLQLVDVINDRNKRVYTFRH